MKKILEKIDEKLFIERKIYLGESSVQRIDQSFEGFKVIDYARV